MGFGKDGKGEIIRENISQALSTLGAATAVLVGGTATMGEDFRILKSEVIAFIEGLTALEGGALELWLVNGELSLAEAEEVLELTGTSDRNDAANRERAHRFVKYVGSFPDLTGLAAVRLISGPEGNLGRSTINPRWTFSDPEAWDFLIYNRGGAALTTGATMRIQAQHYGVWVT